jgi:hypothetical protein
VGAGLLPAWNRGAQAPWRCDAGLQPAAGAASQAAVSGHIQRLVCSCESFHNSWPRRVYQTISRLHHPSYRDAHDSFARLSAAQKGSRPQDGRASWNPCLVFELVLVFILLVAVVVVLALETVLYWQLTICASRPASSLARPMAAGAIQANAFLRAVRLAQIRTGDWQNPLVPNSNSPQTARSSSPRPSDSPRTPAPTKSSSTPTRPAVLASAMTPAALMAGTRIGMPPFPNSCNL